MARGLRDLLPPLEVVAGSWGNADPDGDWAAETGLMARARLDSAGRPARRIVPTPFVQVPLGVTLDRVLGSVDLEASLAGGVAVFEPGLLAASHRGVLHVDDVNLLDESISGLLLSIAECGENKLEREGLSIRHPCRPTLVASYNPADADLHDSQKDRIAMPVPVLPPKDLDERVRAVEAALEFLQAPGTVRARARDATSSIKIQVAAARELIAAGAVTITPRQVEYLVNAAMRAGCVGHRAELFAAQAAMSLAALGGRTRVGAGDLQGAVMLTIAPRAVIRMAPPPGPPPPPPSPPVDDETEPADGEEPPEGEQLPEDGQQQQSPDEIPDQPPEIVLGASQPPGLPQGMIKSLTMRILPRKAAPRGAAAPSGGRTRTRALAPLGARAHGRYVRPDIPVGGMRSIIGAGSLAVDATLRAAAPYQLSRHRRLPGNRMKVIVAEDDVRVKRLARRTSALVIFLVDASGSMALNRMSLAKGAALQLLAESYRSRDNVALISFRNDRAEVLLPPSRSLTLAKRRLEVLPCGGGTPMANGILKAMQIARAASLSKGIAPGRILLIIFTDGRTNVALNTARPKAHAQLSDREPGEPFRPPDPSALRAEVRGLLERAASQGIQLLVIDTEAKFLSTGFAREMAHAGQGRYYALPSGVVGKGIAGGRELGTEFMQAVKDLQALAGSK